jgi:hypothetical protein
MQELLYVNLAAPIAVHVFVESRNSGKLIKQSAILLN